ncbi:MAG: T9SS type A sorting domain-containing protein [Bacteroidales bacterium]|nr:T9SS type A sorting domain-containing protein [Bacteroidales bacterium]
MKREVNIVLGFFILTCLSIFQLAAQQSNPVGVTLIVVNFDQAPDPAQVFIALAPLKYDKDFALSMEIDDGGLTIFEQGFPVFEGGVVNGTTYPGLTYSDGCDNLYHFKMSSVLFSFNGDGENGPDVHVDNAYEMVSWDQLNTLVQNNWGVINHGVNTNANTDPAFMDYSISRNQSYIRRQLYQSTPGGVITHLHVNPNGSEPWTTAASNLGYISTYNQNQPSPLGDHGGNVNNPATDWTQFQNIYRLDAGPTNMQQFVSGLADSSINGANYWGAVFTHSLLTQYPFNTFVSDFNFINNTYGSGGLDNILMTSDEEIRDYLLVRDAVTLNYIVNGSLAYITFTGDVPDNLKFYSMSINISSNTNITGYTVYDTEDYTFNGIGTNQGLINVNWDGLVIPPPEQLADDYTTIAVNSGLQRDAWIAMDYVTTLDEGQHKDSLRHVLCNLGLVYDAGFCSFLTVDLGPDTTICQGNCVPLSGPIDMAYYHWFVADIIYDTVQSILACPMDTTQFILIVEDNFGNVASDSIVITVLPSPNVNLGNDTTICMGGDLTLSGPAAPQGDFYHYQWSTGDTTQSITTTIQEDNTFSLEVTNSYNCSTSDSIFIFAAELPMIDSIIGDTTTCPGDSVHLEVQGTGILTYLWNTGDTTQAIHVSPQTGDSTYVFSVQVFNGYGCRATDSAQIYVSGLPVVDTIIGDTLSCLGDTIQLEVQGSSIESYLWNTGDTTQLIKVSPVVGDSTYTFVVEVTNAYNCTTMDSIDIYVSELPEITGILGDTSVCFGNTIQLEAQGIGIESFLWNTGDTTQIIEVNPQEADTNYTYLVTGFNGYGCQISDSITITVFNAAVTRIVYDTNLVCERSLVQLQGAGADFYVWLPSEETGDIYEFEITDTTKIWLVGTTVNGCRLTDSITLNTLPTPVVSLNGLLPAYCETDPFSILTGLPVGGDFSGDGVTNNLFYPQDAGPGIHPIVYSLKESGCVGYDTMMAVVYGGSQVIDLGPADSLLPTEDLILDAGLGFDNYFWSTGSTDQIIIVRGTDFPPGVYEYKVIALINGCTSSGSVNITFLKPDFIDFSQAGIINLYPNPNTGFFTIVMPYTSNPKTIKLFSMDGNLMFEQNNLFCQDDECRLEVLIPDLNTGIYILQLISGDHVYFKKVMIRK